MKLEKLIDTYKDDIIKSVQNLVKIKSVEGEPKEDMPFGEGPRKALDTALHIAEEMGFRTKNVDGYAGHAEIGEGEETVGILVHLDVVPEGDGWTYPPYEGEIHDGKIYGRGTIDDKGPAVAALYAMKAIKESKLPINKKIRIIFGTNEETGWGGIEYYLNKVKAPDLAFTPDAEFPVIHGEKGIIDLKLKKALESNCIGDIVIKKIKGGKRPNMVPDLAIAELEVNNKVKSNVINKLNEFISKTNYEISIEEKENRLIIKSRGISAHGSTPELGKNAISQLMVILNELDLCECDICNFIKLYNEKIGIEYNGQSIGCGFEDDISGKLTFNVGVIDIDEKGAEITVNIRCPIKYNKKEVFNGIERTLEGTGVEVIEKDYLPSIYVPKDHELVQKLMDVYRRMTGDNNSKPITIGGGTYARAMANAVAFGPLFPGQEELAHQKDEFISIDDLIKITKIYAMALYELSK
ncbi:dipeptidase PepV [Thermohalobacter berrensis]|uniref:Dipeptidase PepV n=1 Tax=Thermohalobacter berrensis TaxID=99594 RepID=A0A419T502_9FIRM|nr:dipeptidase PepV [Thermohalobacter berrensis]RKD32526.1 dipeptidase PepV [Thermohalobacter berrensis]